MGSGGNLPPDISPAQAATSDEEWSTTTDQSGDQTPPDLGGARAGVPGTPVVINATLDFSTFLGGSDVDSAEAVAVDTAGNVYITGLTDSVDFPLHNPWQGGLRGPDDAFITKFDPTGATLLYSTYLGGTGSDVAWAIDVDEEGNTYIAGHTYSDDFPVVNAFQGQQPGYGDGFVTKLDASGTSLAYSTYLGGSNLELALGIAVDSTGHAVVTGHTDSPDFPVANPFQFALAGGFDAFVTKFDPAGSTVAYSSFAGGSAEDHANAAAVDDQGNAYLCGDTNSTDFPVFNAFQVGKAGTYDAFVMKVPPEGGSLVYSTYLGGLRRDNGYGISVDPSGRAYVTGDTLSDDFPIQDAFQGNRAGGPDVFVTVFEPSGTTLKYSTYLGGSNNDYPASARVTPLGQAFVSGSTVSLNFPTKYPIQARNAGLTDAFISAFPPSGSALIFSTYLGGSTDDYGRGLAVSASGEAIVVGSTTSPDFPVFNAFQDTYAGGYSDAFVTKILLQTCPHGPC